MDPSLGTIEEMKPVFVTLTSIVVLAVLGYAGYRAYHHYTKSSPVMYTAPTSQTMMKGTMTPTQGSGLKNKDTSDTQINQDTQDIQKTMDMLQQDQNTTSQDTTNQTLDTPLQ